jgi:hypothetical protein
MTKPWLSRCLVLRLSVLGSQVPQGGQKRQQGQAQNGEIVAGDGFEQADGRAFQPVAAQPKTRAASPSHDRAHRRARGEKSRMVSSAVCTSDHSSSPFRTKATAACRRWVLPLAGDPAAPRQQPDLSGLCKSSVHQRQGLVGTNDKDRRVFAAIPPPPCFHASSMATSRASAPSAQRFGFHSPFIDGSRKALAKCSPALSSKALRVLLADARINMGPCFPHCHPQLKPCAVTMTHEFWPSRRTCSTWLPKH